MLARPRASLPAAVATAILAAAGFLFPSEASSADREAFTRPDRPLSEAERARFFEGRQVFRQPWLVEPAAETAFGGLGPLFNQLSCVGCHPGNGRGHAPDGPGDPVQAMLVKLSAPGLAPNGGPLPHSVYGEVFNERAAPGLPAEGIVRVSYGERAETLAGGETVILRQPHLMFDRLAYGPLDKDVLTSPRIGPPVYGLGLLEAVPEDILEALARERRGGTHGRVNRVWDATRKMPAVGRFGWKANQPSLAQQIAGAFAGDMGLTSALFPQGNCAPEQHACRAAVTATPEVSAVRLDLLDFHHRHLAVPARRNTGDPQVKRGEALFQAAGCASCHVPDLIERTPPYTDLLLHDMGEGLADGRPDFLAGGRDWRTPPLWGMGLAKVVDTHAGFLHDGRARTPLEAILWHGGEAEAAREAVRAMPKSDREALLGFLDSL